MIIKVAHQRWWQIFEVVFGLPFLAAVILHVVVPLALPSGFLPLALIPIGTILIIGGTVIVILARRQFAAHQQPSDPGLPTRRLIMTSVFSISRNPLYLGGVCIIVGIALACNLLWIFVLLLPALVACHYVLIAPEERYLATTFGAEYRTYAASVHRWIGRARQSKQV